MPSTLKDEDASAEPADKSEDKEPSDEKTKEQPAETDDTKPVNPYAEVLAEKDSTQQQDNSVEGDS